MGEGAVEKEGLIHGIAQSSVLFLFQEVQTTNSFCVYMYGV